MKPLARLKRLSLERGRGVRERKPEPCLIARLPDELLSDIFIQCLPQVEVTRDALFSDNNSVPAGHRRRWILAREAPLNVSHVCQHWRTVALSTARLWTVICFPGFHHGHEPSVEHGITAAFLERSLSAPLDIIVPLKFLNDLSILDLSQDSALIEAVHWLQSITEQKHRWRGIHISLLGIHFLEPILKFLFQSGDAPIKELYIDCEAFPNGDSAVPSVPCMPRVSQLTMLHFHSNNYHSFREWSTLCSSLREVHISCSIPLLDVHTWLDSCPALEVAVFSRIVLPVSDDVWPQTHRMGGLRKLSLKFDGPPPDVDINIPRRAVYAAILSLHLPVLEDLSLLLPWSPQTHYGGLSQLIAFLYASKPPLYRLHIAGFEDDWLFGAFAELDGDIPQLQILDLDAALTVHFSRWTTDYFGEARSQSYWPELRCLYVWPVVWPVLDRVVQFIWWRSGMQRGSDVLDWHAIKQLVVCFMSEELARELRDMLRRDHRVITMMKAGFSYEFEYREL